MPNFRVCYPLKHRGTHDSSLEAESNFLNVYDEKNTLEGNCGRAGSIRLIRVARASSFHAMQFDGHFLGTNVMPNEQDCPDFVEDDMFEGRGFARRGVWKKVQLPLCRPQGQTAGIYVQWHPPSTTIILEKKYA